MKWLVRAVVFGCLAAMVLVGIFYQFLTNPEAVRQQVLDRIGHDLVNVQTSLESARLRLLGGIEVRELRLSRKDDLDRSDFLHIPAATIYHDKEQVLEGALSLRKVEVRRPRLRLVRDHEGRWNLTGLMGPSDARRRLPVLIVRQGVLVVEDRRAAPGTPPLEIRDISASVVNDPLPVVVFEGAGTVETAGLVQLRGRATRGGGLSLSIEAPDLTLGPELLQRLAGYAPEAAVHLRGLNARSRVRAEVTWEPGLSHPILRYSIHGEVKSGEFAHARLPWPLRQMTGSVTVQDGQVPEARLRGMAGQAEIEVQLRGGYLTPGLPLTERADSLMVSARNLPVDSELFRYLPASLQSYQTEYSPRGVVNCRLDLKRQGPGTWVQTGSIEAVSGTGCYTHFRYPVSDIRGTITWELTTDFRQSNSLGQASDWFAIDLRGEAAGRPVYLKGHSRGQRGISEITYDLWGNELPLDENLLSLLPQRVQHQARNFDPSGQFDYRVFLRRESGGKEVSKRFLIYLHHCKVNYKVFPLPLHDVSGTLDLRPDSWEFRDFTGKYAGGVIRASGRSRLMPPSRTPAGPIARRAEGVRTVSLTEEEEAEATPPPSRVSLLIEGHNLPVDDTFKAALAPGREALAKAVNTFELTGKLNFSAHIDDLPNTPRDIDVTVRIGGCRINPAFFPYALQDVAATVRYARNNVWVTGFQGRHGATTIHVKQGTVVLPPEGGYWVRLDRLHANPLKLDAELQKALPPGMGKLARILQLDEPINLASVLVVNQPAAIGARPTIYWDASLALKDTRLVAGPEWSRVTGVLSSQGVHNGTQLEDVVGNVFLEKATILNQPVKNLHIPLVIWKETPDILRLPNVKADLFGGTIDGQGRVEFGSIFRYELVLNASRIQLEQMGKHNLGSSADLSGLANGSIHLTGEGTEIEGLKGNGRVEVPSGKLYRLPLLLDLLKWLGLRVPDRTAFEQARADFRIEGSRLHLGKLDLYGSAISIRGQGSMNLDGSDVRLDLNADWGRLSEILPATINKLSREVSNQLLRVKVRGKVGELKFEQELVPIVTDPVKRIWNGMTTKDNGAQ